MRWAFRLLSFAIVATMLGSGLPAAQPLSTRERELLSPRAANKVVQQDMLSVLRPLNQIRSGMLRRLRGLGLTTKAYETEYAGLCRRDVVTLFYAPTAKSERYEDTPIAPYGIEASPYFHIVTMPREEERADELTLSERQRRCSAADEAEQSNWYAAPNAHVAVAGARVLESMVSAVRSGALKAEPCSQFDTRVTTCEAIILTNAKTEAIDEISSCHGEGPIACYVVIVGNDTELTIKAEMNGDGLTPKRVISVAMEQFIVVT